MLYFYRNLSKKSGKYVSVVFSTSKTNIVNQRDIDKTIYKCTPIRKATGKTFTVNYS